MRWRLLRRRLSVSAPSVAIRSYLPWPLRWAVIALALGFSAAIALWAFEFGRELAGIERGGRSLQEEVTRLRQELADVRQDRDQARSIANSADSLLRAERVTQQRLNDQVRELEAQIQNLKDELGFYERLLPATGAPLAIRGLQVEAVGPGQWRYQLLIMQQSSPRQAPPPFKGRVELQVFGTRDGRPWTNAPSVIRHAIDLTLSQRLSGVLTVPEGVKPNQMVVKLIDAHGTVKLSQVQRL